MGMKRRPIAVVVIVIVIVAVIIVGAVVIFPIVERPITAPPENIAINLNDLPQGWNLTNNNIYWANNVTEPRGSGWTWMAQLDFYNLSGNQSVWIYITSFNTTIDAKSAYSNWFSVYGGYGWVFENLSLGDEGARVKTPYSPEGSNSNSYADYFWREGNVWVQMEFRSGVIIDYQPWMDEVVSIQASKLHHSH